jgi:4-hydroxy-tetrahydrodipicolinate synthase
MTVDEKLSLYEKVSQLSRQYRIPFAIGISATTIGNVIKLALKAVEVGCDGIMLGLPPYLRLCQEEIIQYVYSVRNVVPSTIPILLYNNIMRNGYGATAETLVQLSQQGVIWGVKQASANLNDFQTDCNRIFSLDQNIKLFTGSDTLIKELLFDGVLEQKFYGLTSIVGNIFPASMGLMVADLVETSENDTGVVTNHNLIHRQKYLKELSDTVLLGCTLPVGVKYGLKVNKVHAGDTRRPVGYLTEEKKHQIESIIVQFREYSSIF